MLYQCFYWYSGIILPSKENDLGHRELRTKEKLCLIVKPKHSFIDGPKHSLNYGRFQRRRKKRYTLRSVKKVCTII